MAIATQKELNKAIRLHQTLKLLKEQRRAVDAELAATNREWSKLDESLREAVEWQLPLFPQLQE